MADDYKLSDDYELLKLEENTLVVGTIILVTSFIQSPLFIVAGLIALNMRPKVKKDADNREFLYFDKTQLQRIGGYRNSYEQFTTNELVCDIDTLKTTIKNTKNQETDIWLWKGDYNMMGTFGWCKGAEVGAYTNENADLTIFESVSWILKERLDIVGSQDELVLLRLEDVRREFWVNGFVRGKNCVASNLILDVSITFNEAGDAINYAKILREGIQNKNNSYFPSNLANGEDRSDKTVRFDKNVRIKGKTVNVIFQ
jgi:hypothetical protein